MELTIKPRSSPSEGNIAKIDIVYAAGGATCEKMFDSTLLILFRLTACARAGTNQTASVPIVVVGLPQAAQNCVVTTHEDMA
jgi:hypothetical protein